MYQFKKTQSVAFRVNEVIKSHIETRGENWLLGLGYMECNDYAQSVVSLIGALSGDYVRFETVARYIRQHKSRIRVKQATTK